MQASTLQPTPEPFPPVNITTLSLEQRVDFAGQLLADPHQGGCPGHREHQ